VLGLARATGRLPRVHAPHHVRHDRSLPGGDGEPSLGRLIRRLRLRAGITQEALAERAGVSLATIEALEGDRRRQPYPHTVVALAEALGLSADERAALQAAVPQREQTAAPTPSPDTTQSAVRARLPVPPTPLIGREVEVAAAMALLDPAGSAVRLLTLTGPGGVGKTRLALAVAAARVDAYPDGVVFVDLAPLRDTRLVPATIAHALEVREAAGRSARELLLEYLPDRQLLLVLDNFEHVLGAAATLLAELLQGCPRLALLVTSRAPLRLRAEQRFDVAPLPAPAAQDVPSVDAIAASPAVRLFVERAQAISPDFLLDASNARVVAAICRQLDGIPLAIELAAARVGLLRPDALLRRLAQRLPLLTGGPADLPERQQTLTKTLAWSHDLLAPGAQALFRRLAVFEGGGTLEAVERVGVEPPWENTRAGALSPTSVSGADDLLETLQALVDNSLLLPIQTPTGQQVFAMLETVREYAGERLRQSGEMEEIRTRHLFWYLDLAEDAAPELTGPRQGLWLDRLDEVLDNLRAALNWAQASGQTEVGLRLAGALGRFWSTRRYVGEGREWLERFLDADAAGQCAPVMRASASYAAGVLANIQGDHARAVRRLDESTSLYQAAGDLIGAVRAQDTRGGVVYDQGHLAEALALWEQTLVLARAAGSLGDVAHLVGNQGEVLFHMGDLAGAEAHHTEALAIARQAGRTDVEAMQLGDLGNVARQRGDLPLATDLQRQALRIKQALGARRQIAITLADFASIAGAAGDGPRAARLYAAAMALRADIGLPQPVPERTDTEQAIAPAVAALTEEARAAAFAEGRQMTIEQAIAYALQ